MRKSVRRYALGSAMCLFLSGCIRNVIVHEFRDPEMRLRSGVVPELVATQPDRAPLRNIEVSIDVTAPKDSALMLVLAPDIPYSRLEPFIGGAGVRFMRESQAFWVHDGKDTVAPSIMRVTLRDTTDLVRQIEGMRYSRQARTTRFLGNNFVDSSFAQSPWLMVVRRGTASRIRVRSVVAASEGLEDVLYHVRYQWIAVPDTGELACQCAREPTFVYANEVPACARVLSDGATARRLESYTHLIHENGWVIGGVGVGLSTAIWLISRP